MGNLSSRYEPDIDTIRKFASDGNKYAQFDLGMLFANKILKDDADSDSESPQGEWYTIDLNEPLFSSGAPLTKKNPGIYWLSQAAMKWVPRAIHVLAYFIYQHYKHFEKTAIRPDSTHDYFLKASLKLCSIAMEQASNPIYLTNPDLQQYAIDVDKLEDLATRIRRDIFDRFVLSGMEIADLKDDMLNDIITRCCVVSCNCAV